nr:unnamed protein product [Digitaria exilis]
MTWQWGPHARGWDPPPFFSPLSFFLVLILVSGGLGPRRPAMLRRMVSDPTPDSTGDDGDGEARPCDDAFTALFVEFAAKRLSDGESSRSPMSALDRKVPLLRSPRSSRTWGVPGLIETSPAAPRPPWGSREPKHELCAEAHIAAMLSQRRRPDELSSEVAAAWARLAGLGSTLGMVAA